MNLKDKKRLGRILLVALITVQPLLIGAKFFDLQLRNVNRPLVDMTKLVNGNSITAKAQELSESKDNKSKPPQKTTDDKTNPAKDDSARAAAEDKTTNVGIRVSGESIYVNNRLVTLDGFEKAFEGVYKKGAGVTLTDDYADYKVMMRVTEYLDGKGIFYRIEETR